MKKTLLAMALVIASLTASAQSRRTDTPPFPQHSVGEGRYEGPPAVAVPPRTIQGQGQRYQDQYYYESQQQSYEYQQQYSYESQQQYGYEYQQQEYQQQYRPSCSNPCRSACSRPTCAPPRPTYNCSVTMYDCNGRVLYTYQGLADEPSGYCSGPMHQCNGDVRREGQYGATCVQGRGRGRY